MFLIVFFSVAAALGLLAILVFVATSGRLCVETRRRIELGLMVFFYPSFMVFMGWQALDYAVQHDWLPAILFVAMAAFLGADGYGKLGSRLRSDRAAQ
ncbi:hypothetical protein HZ989_05035 [Brevundimonas sp. AJA228-03]|uniref:hypothetical protein n=1 Tax=Brevundimonas sp. AJA228-03 TaxID=2752515 RepID=UPI001AE002D0|nr:hypothetical protein [Brevundimonas sp. AJA228-03]QTN20430.1 hypothetical protein HZ989_05035 [Brevundimonas sp. AJA228-03]